MTFFNPSAHVRRNLTFYAQILQAIAIVFAGAWAAWTYHQQVRREYEKPYYEKQLGLYLDAARVVANLATLPEGTERQKAVQRFWELYWGELAFVESNSVEGMMRNYCDQIFDVSHCDHLQSPNPRLGDALNFSHLASQEIRQHWRPTVSEQPWQQRALKWINVGAAALAALLWLASALVKIPDLIETSMSGPGSITDIIRKQSYLSAAAAFFTAISVGILAYNSWID